MSEDKNRNPDAPANAAPAKARKMAKLAWSQSSFDLLASGYSPEQIAEVRKVSVRTIRREIDSAIARRQLDAPDRYVHLQVARLTKALRFADAALERGDLKAVRALVTVVAAMDRYHGLSDAFEGARQPRLPDPLELQARRPAASQAVPCLFASRRGAGGSRRQGQVSAPKRLKTIDPDQKRGLLGGRSLASLRTGCSSESPLAAGARLRRDCRSIL